MSVNRNVTIPDGAFIESSARARSICSKAYVTMAALVMFRPVRANDSYASAPSTSRRWVIAAVVSG